MHPGQSGSSRFVTIGAMGAGIIKHPDVAAWLRPVLINNPACRGLPLIPQQARRPKRYERQFECGAHTVTIVWDESQRPRLYHWLIQETGKPQLLSWGQQPTEEEAEREAIECLLYFDRRAEAR